MTSIPFTVIINPQVNNKSIVYLNDTKNLVDVHLLDFVKIPQGSSIYLQHCSFYHNFPNVSSSDYLIVESSTNSGGSYTEEAKLEFVDGLFSPEGLNKYIADELKLDNFSNGSVVLTPSYSTEKIIISLEGSDFSSFLSTATNRIRIKLSENLKEITGLTDDSVFDSSTSHIYGQQKARFNIISSILIKLPTLMGSSSNIYNGISASSVLESIPITAPPGTSNFYSPFFPVKVPILDKSFNSFRVEIKNQDDEDITLTNLLTLKFVITQD